MTKRAVQVLSVILILRYFHIKVTSLNPYLLDQNIYKVIKFHIFLSTFQQITRFKQTPILMSVF